MPGRTMYNKQTGACMRAAVAAAASDNAAAHVLHHTRARPHQAQQHTVHSSHNSRHTHLLPLAMLLQLPPQVATKHVPTPTCSTQGADTAEPPCSCWSTLPYHSLSHALPAPSPFLFNDAACGAAVCAPCCALQPAATTTLNSHLLALVIYKHTSPCSATQHQGAALSPGRVIGPKCDEGGC